MGRLSWCNIHGIPNPLGPGKTDTGNIITKPSLDFLVYITSFYATTTTPSIPSGTYLGKNAQGRNRLTDEKAAAIGTLGVQPLEYTIRAVESPNILMEIVIGPFLATPIILLILPNLNKQDVAAKGLCPDIKISSPHTRVTEDCTPANVSLPSEPAIGAGEGYVNIRVSRTPIGPHTGLEHRIRTILKLSLKRRKDCPAPRTDRDAISNLSERRARHKQENDKTILISFFFDFFDLAVEFRILFFSRDSLLCLGKLKHIDMGNYRKLKRNNHEVKSNRRFVVEQGTIKRYLFPSFLAYST
jgi:hypothetical protein